MKTLQRITQEEFNNIYRLHDLWRDNKKGGERGSLSNLNLNNLKLSKLNLGGFIIDNCIFASNIMDTMFLGTEITNCDFSKCKLMKVKFLSCKIKNCDFYFCEFYDCKISHNLFIQNSIENSRLSDSTILENDGLICIGPIGSSKSHLYAVNYVDDIMFKTHHLWGNEQYFLQHLKINHVNNSDSEQYKIAIKLAKNIFSSQNKN